MNKLYTMILKDGYKANLLYHENNVFTLLLERYSQKEIGRGSMVPNISRLTMKLEPRSGVSTPIYDRIIP